MTLEHSLVMERAIGRMFDNQRRSDQDRYEERLSYAERCARAEEALAGEFLALVEAGNVDAVAPFESCERHDWKTDTKRPSTLFDVLADTVEYDDFQHQLMALFVRAVNGSHISADAKELAGKMAASYANINVKVD